MVWFADLMFVFCVGVLVWLVGLVIIWLFN